MSTLPAGSAPPGSNAIISATKPLQPAGSLYETRQTEKKGLGLYAKVDIAEGTVISQEITIQIDFGEYNFSAATWESPKFWDALRSHEDRPVEDAVSGLIALYKDDAFVQTVLSQLSRSLSMPGLSDHENLFFTNCHPLKFTSPPFSGFFGPVTCSFNHGCIGNAAFSVSGTKDHIYLVTNVVAVKPIKAGTEITIPYNTSSLTTAERRLSLREIFRFDCVCEVCMDVTPQTIETFAKVIALLQVVEAPLDYECKQKTPWVFFKSAFQLGKEYKKLGIKDLRCATLWEHCASVAAYHSDALRTHYCLIWAAAYWKTLGPGRAVQMRSIVNRPELHPRWGNTTLGLSSMADDEVLRSRFQSDEALLRRILMAGHDDTSYDRIKPREEDLAEKEKLAEQKRTDFLAELDEEEGKKKKKEPAAVPMKKAKKKRSKKQRGKGRSAGGADEGGEGAWETVVPASLPQVERLNVVEEGEEDGAGGAADWEEVGPKKRQH